jgi:cytidylate kinase
MRNNMIITIDGPAGAGKSTISKILAEKLNYTYLDTGAMYRAVALEAHRNGINIKDGKALGHMCRNMDINFLVEGPVPKIHIGEEDVSTEIRRPEMDMMSSSVSSVKEVRAAMTEIQRKIGMTGRLVAEGRDMGSVVFPDADYKFFITASPEERARRRYEERIERNEKVEREFVEVDIKKRDEQDSSRSIAPLRRAEDAIVIDTTDLSIDQVIDCILAQIDKRSN